MLQAQTVEKRKFKRYSCRLKVYQQATNELLGYAEDIQLEGMRLKSTLPIPEKVELNVYLGVMPYDKNADQKISLSMYRVWSGFPDDDSQFHYSGMHFVNPSEEALDGIQELIEFLNE